MDRYNLSVATPDLFNTLGHIMYDAVRHGKSLYTQAQRAVWMPAPREGEAWAKRLAPQHIFIGTAENDTIRNSAGFMSVTPDGYVDFAYIRPGAQGTGLFRALYENIEAFAYDQKMPQLHTHASLMAQPAFNKMGFKIIQKETVAIQDEQFDRYEMMKPLPPP